MNLWVKNMRGSKWKIILNLFFNLELEYYIFLFLCRLIEIEEMGRVKVV